MTAPTQDECRALLEDGGRRLHTDLWEIGSYAYTEADALALAELCLRLGQPLSAAITTQMFLTVVRRLDAVEAVQHATPLETPTERRVIAVLCDTMAQYREWMYANYARATAVGTAVVALRADSPEDGRLLLGVSVDESHDLRSTVPSPDLIGDVVRTHSRIRRTA